MQEVVERSADVLANLKALSEQIQDIVSNVQQGKGTIGKLLTDDQAYNRFNSILGKADQIASTVQSGQGTLGKLIMKDEMGNKSETTVDQINTILADLRAQKGTLGKLLYHPLSTIKPRKRSPTATPSSVTFALAKAPWAS